MILALVSSVCLCVISRAKGFGAADLLRANLIMKLVMVPGYILIFILGIILLITIFTMGISIALMVLDLWTVLCGGIFGLAGVLRAGKEGLLTKGLAALFGICQFIFVFDVITALAAYICVKRG